MSAVHANQLLFEVETRGDPAHPAVVLIMGLGMQLTAWPEAFVDQLVAGGYYVIRFDNRDIGLSSKFDDAPRHSLGAAMLRNFLHLPGRAPYKLADMARDTLALMSALNVPRAHVVGVSMGGMVAQIMAATAAARVLSLSSIMSTSGARRLPGPRPEAMQALLSKPDNPDSIESLVSHFVGVYKVLGSPGFPVPEDLMRANLTRSLTRSYYPRGTARQMLAIVASGDRSKLLRTISVPALVLHGKEDPLIPVQCGHDTAAKIPRATLQVIAGMGHNLPPDLVPILTRSLIDHFRSSTP
jgi:pimeloyl-ACP methyl ester carboxylesterase